MAEHQPIRTSNALHANLVVFIFIVNFIVIGGLILATMPASPQVGEEEQPVVALVASAAATPLPPTVTPPEPTLMATPLPPTAATASIPTQAPVVQNAFAGDPANGQVLFNTFQPAASFACATCHYVDREDQLIGPGLLNVSRRAESRVPGMSVYDYLHTSIVNPGAFVVPNFPDGLMPRNWAEIYSEQEINDLIAYLMTLQ
jgi:mono/diheme cytochrome c family protein